MGVAGVFGGEVGVEGMRKGGVMGGGVFVIGSGIEELFVIGGRGGGLRGKDVGDAGWSGGGFFVLVIIISWREDHCVGWRKVSLTN